MILYVNGKNEVVDVNATENKNLIPLVVNEDIEENKSFLSYSIAKMCCYKVEVENGILTSYIPYVNDKLIQHIDRLSTQNMSAQAQIDYIAMMTDVEM